MLLQVCLLFFHPCSCSGAGEAIYMLEEASPSCLGTAERKRHPRKILDAVMPQTQTHKQETFQSSSRRHISFHTGTHGTVCTHSSLMGRSPTETCPGRRLKVNMVAENHAGTSCCVLCKSTGTPNTDSQPFLADFHGDWTA